MNYDSENVYDAEYIARRKREMVPDGHSVRVPVLLMDSAQRDAYSRTGKSEAVLARDEAHAVMVNRMVHPKSYDLHGRKIVNDGAVDDLSEAELFLLAQRLSGPLGIAPPADSYLQGRVDPVLSRSRPATEAAPPNHGDNRRPHAKQARDHATGVALRDQAYAEYLARLTGGRR